MTGIESQHIIVVGDVMADIYTYGNASRVSPEAPCLVLSDTRTEQRPGGAANVACQLAAMGAHVELYGIAGDDEPGKCLRTALVRAGITAHLAPGNHTTAKHRIISASNHQLLRIDNDLLTPLSPTALEALLAAITQSHPALIVLSDYNKGVLQADACRSIIDTCRQAGVPVLVDIKDTPFSKYSGATMIKGNKTEISRLCSDLGIEARDTHEQLLREVCAALQCRYAAMTLGPDGICMAAADGTAMSFKAPAAQVYDVTGAGDVVLAYLAPALIGGVSPDTAATDAVRAAAIKVSRTGTGIVRPGELSPAGKILHDASELPASVAGAKVVFTNGCFDVLHAGHIDLLEQARAQGDILIVGINTDESVRRLKGAQRPVNPLAERAHMLAALRCVDYVVPFADDTPIELIRHIRPQVLVKGGDYTPDTVVGADLVSNLGGKVMIVPLRPHCSSTRIIQACGI